MSGRDKKISPKKKRAPRKKELKNDVELAVASVDAYADLNFAESIFLKYYLSNGGNQTAAARAAWPNLSYSAAATMAWRVMMRSRPIIASLMDSRGLKTSTLLRLLEEGVCANKIISINKEKLSVPDWPARHKYLETALKLKGYLSREFDAIVINQPPVVAEISQVKATNTDGTMSGPEIGALFTEWYSDRVRANIRNKADKEATEKNVNTLINQI